MDLRPHLKKGIWAITDKSLTGIYGFAFIFLVIAQLPSEEYGIFSITFAIASMALLFNKSFILYPMTKFEAEGESQPSLLGNTVIFSFGVLSIFGLLIFLFAPIAAAVFHSSSMEKLLKLIPLLLYCFYLRDFSLSYLVAHGKIKSLVLLDCIYFLGTSIGYASMNITGKLNTALDVIWIHIFFAAASSLVGYIVIKKSIKFKFKVKREELSRICRFGRFSFCMGIGETIFYQLDLLILGKFFGPAPVAIYNAAKNLYRIYPLFSQGLNLLVFPATSKLALQHRAEDIKSMFSKVVAYYWSIILPLNLILFLSADFIMGLINYPQSANIFRIFLIFAFFEPLYNISLNVLYGMGKPNLSFKPLLFAVPLYIALNLSLIPFMNGTGAAIAFNLNNVFIGLFYLKILKREIDMNPNDILSYFIRSPITAMKVLSQLLHGDKHSVK